MMDRIRLPFAYSPIPNSVPTARKMLSQENGQRSTILIVEDNDLLRGAYAESLENAGFAVIEAENGVAALHIFATQPINLIIMDVVMPVLDGLTTLARIRKTSDIPVIMVSSVTDERIIARLRQYGIDKFLNKVSLEDLVTAVKTVLAARGKSVNRKRLIEQ